MHSVNNKKIICTFDEIRTRIETDNRRLFDFISTVQLNCQSTLIQYYLRYRFYNDFTSSNCSLAVLVLKKIVFGGFSMPFILNNSITKALDCLRVCAGNYCVAGLHELVAFYVDCIQQNEFCYRRL